MLIDQAFLKEIARLLRNSELYTQPAEDTFAIVFNSIVLEMQRV
jgi:hypothetical protein